MKTFRFFAALVAASLIGAMASTAISPMLAQATSAPITIITTTDGTVISESVPEQLTLSGSDLALRVERIEKGKVVGTLMAKVNGKWAPVQMSSSITLAH